MVVFTSLLLLGALAGATPVDVPREPRRIDVKAFEWDVSVEAIVLGETGEVPLTISAQLPDGAPFDVAPPILRASTGALSRPERVGPGRWSTTFTPPKERFPHVAILSAQVDQAESSTVGFFALPLWGKGRLEVKTKPDSSVVVYIGSRDFGPVRADRRGSAYVDILAPPGPERAVARSVDPAGNESQKTVDLGVPPFNRLALVKIDEVAAADGTGEAQLLAFAVDKKGAPLFDAPLEVSASVGSFEGEPLAIAPGVYRLRFRPGKAPKGSANIEASLQGSQASSASAEVRLLSGPAVRAELVPSTTSVRADGDTTVVVTARLFDQAGNAVPREAGRVDVSAGRINDLKPAADDAVTVTWVLPGRIPAETPRLTARTTTGEVLGSVEVAVEPGAPVSLLLERVAPVVADGQSSAPITVRVRDVAGNPLLPESLTLSTTAGQIIGPSPEGDALVAQLIPDLADQEGIATITGAVGDVRAETTVRVLPRPRARLLVGAGLASSWNYGSLYAAGPDLSFLVRLPGFDGSGHAGVSLGYLVALPSDLEGPDGKTLTRQHSAVPLHLEAGWRPLLTTSLSVHLGGAVGIVLSDLSLQGPSSRVPQRTVTTAVSAQAVAGLAYRLGPGLVEADLRAGWAQPFSDVASGPPLGAGLVLTYRFGI